MPKKVETYLCIHCGKVYDKLDDATKHENLHVLPVSIVEAEYSNSLLSTTEAPVSIDVKFSDNSIRTYYRERD